MIRSFVLRATASAAFIAGIACHDSTGPDNELVSARERWTAYGSASYSYQLSRSCFCPRETVGPVLIVVQNGVVQSRVYTETGAAVPPNYQMHFPTIDGLFSQIDSLHNTGVGSLKATYDAVYGYPTRVAVDVILQAVDDEFTYMASDYIKR